MSTDHQNVTDVTAALTAIWRDVLKDQDLDETTDLFDAGGSSMQVLEIIGKIYDVLGVDIRLRDVFEHTSPQSLSELISNQPASRE